MQVAPHTSFPHRPPSLPSSLPSSFSSSSSLSRFCFVCAHFIPCAASWQAGQGLPSHHTPFPSHAAWGRNTRCPRQGQAQTAHTTLPPSSPPTLLIGRPAKEREKRKQEKKEPALLLLTQMILSCRVFPQLHLSCFILLLPAALCLTVHY